MIKTISYHISDEFSLGVIGAIHGNEKCGTMGIMRVIEEIDNQTITLKKGTLNLMPIANPRAYNENVRFIERNLNRFLFVKDTKQYYEDFLDPIVCGFIAKSDFLLDLHSYSTNNFYNDDPAFLFIDGNDKQELNYAKNVGVNKFVYGWFKAFESNNTDKESQGTTEYARSIGKKGITVECGQHLYEHAPQIAYETIINSLIYFDMLDENCPAFKQHKKPHASEQICVHMQDVYYRHEGDELSQNWQHFEPVTKGQVLATRANGDKIIAKDDGHIILPKLTAKDNEEWFYFGTKDIDILR